MFVAQLRDRDLPLQPLLDHADVSSAGNLRRVAFLICLTTSLVISLYFRLCSTSIDRVNRTVNRDERCKPLFIVRQNWVRASGASPGLGWEAAIGKARAAADSMRHFRTGSSNSGFQPRRSASKENGKRTAGAGGCHQAPVSQRLDRARQQAAQPVEYGRGSNYRKETVRKLPHQAG